MPGADGKYTPWERLAIGFAASIIILAVNSIVLWLCWRGVAPQLGLPVITWWETFLLLMAARLLGGEGIVKFKGLP